MMISTLEPITEFKNEYRWLSNFYVEPCGLTVEHRFQSWKAMSSDDAQRILGAPSPGEAKRIGRSIACRPDWEKIKTEVMIRAVYQKFADQDLQQRLISTGYAPLVEGNTWGDHYWGADLETGEGENRLGKILMLIRLSCQLRVKI